ncbi:hypothetical protein FLL45_19265 [Aliikangiella marina]|uniref:DUF2306 domain-containing protein n=1 Tax=Aliikangiella marina TaxID=1712262 RepID=A0A545T560_9GAMM|nr:hypothetical protein [Aliikangiella marina]TQV72356.1 hypothetical protein FLL45_19265 [Aliikangiella marina]
MPLSPMGILHTVVGMVALISGFMMLWQSKQMTYKSVTGKTYLIATLITAASALTIFRHGGFNAAHGLAILTILAVFSGLIIEKTVLFKSWNKYFTNLCYSATILFHLIPTATEILTRFPMDAPIVTSLKDPFLQKTFLVILIVFLIMLTWQMVWLRRQK